MELKAKWIWAKRGDYTRYNQTILARRSLRLGEVRRAVIRITADSYYRLLINGRWVGDGPQRAWPEHYQYDELDVTAYLRRGENEVAVIARYFGVGTFHQVPQHPGLLAQLDIKLASGRKRTVVTDGNWEVAEAPQWVANTPKVSIQMEPCEYYNALLESKMRFGKAAVLFSADGGPWSDLRPGDVAPLTREPVGFERFGGASVVSADTLNVCVPTARLLYPGAIEANRNVLVAAAIATVIDAPKSRSVSIVGHGLSVTVNGKSGRDGVFRLRAGRNILLAVTTEIFGHLKEHGLSIFDIGIDPAGLKFANPVRPAHANPWCFVPCNGPGLLGDDMDWRFHQDPEHVRLRSRIEAELAKLAAEIRSPSDFVERLGGRAVCMPADRMFVHDVHALFRDRRVIARAGEEISNPCGLMYDNEQMTTVRAAARGDVELLYDLGRQVCGYYELELIADAGVVADIFGVEYISGDGRIQHTRGNRNGLRYVCRKGVNRFVSLKRRSGRYLFITLRNQTPDSAVRIRLVRVIESTYPVRRVGSFACSDPRLEDIWAISRRTLQLCMEDTFTDCPLYEQTLWVGDARNEAVFAYYAFDAADIARRCIELAGESLERYPITGCQVPSGWDCLLPAWSFLWGISVWDYYFYTGDRKFLRTAWKWVDKNLRGARGLLDENGLFSGPFWNLFDWTGIDDKHDTVLHNSILLVGAIDSGVRCAEVLGKSDRKLKWLGEFRSQLAAAINRFWDERIGAYPDSIHSDGTPSASVSQHTSFLGVLYDVVPRKGLTAAIRNMTDPPEGMIRVGSPFAIMYLYEALEKIGTDAKIIESIYEKYLLMIEAGATTVWEVFPTSDVRPSGFPTRSHCHAWSSAPLYFLNRIILGIRQCQEAVGGKAFEISPRLCGLTWARGTTASARGPVSVEWKVSGKKLNVTITAPKGVACRFLRNETHKGLRISVHNRMPRAPR